MSVYAKINAPFKRHTSGPEKGKLIIGEWSVPEFEYLANNQWEFTEKVDGMNCRVIWNAYSGTVDFMGRTDNAQIPKPLMEYFQATFTADRLFSAGLLGSFVLYGEGYGPKIQSGGLYRKDQSFVLFDVLSNCGIIEAWNINHSGQPLVTPSVGTSPEGFASNATESVSVAHKNTKTSGVSGLRSVESSPSQKSITAEKAVSGILKTSLESLSRTTRPCLHCKTEFVPYATSQKLPEAEMGEFFLSPLTTATTRFVLEAYCAKDVMSAWNLLNETLNGSTEPRITSRNWWLSRDNVNDIADKLGIESVPVLGTGSLWQAFTLVRTGKTRDLAGNTIDLSLNGRLKSQWGDFEAEGIVCRTTVPLFNSRGERITCKVKSVDFK